MSGSNNQISPQVDVAGATLQGLAAFTPILAALSSDNVAPMAMVQAEALGALFHVNGKYAAQVPDLLTRVVSTRLHRVGLTIGWRKGDAASTLATSAGGQAFAMLSLVLHNLYRAEAYGAILRELSLKLLPRSIAISSVSQLVDVAKVACSKIERLGFGNELAIWVSHIHNLYAESGKPFPQGLLTPLPTTLLIELFCSLSRLRDENLVLRIKGVQGAGFVFGILTFMFPDSVTIVIDGVVVFNSHSEKILIEFGCQSTFHLEFTIETQLGTVQNRVQLPIVKIDPVEPPSYLQFRWKGWIAKSLNLVFLDIGIVCPESILKLCCNLLLQSVNSPSEFGLTRINGWPRDGMKRLLGPYATHRVREICKTVWGVDFGTSLEERNSTFSVFSNTLMQELGGLNCHCSQHCSVRNVFGSMVKMQSCDVDRVLRAIENALARGICCLVIDASDYSTIAPGPYNLCLNHKYSIEQNMSGGNLFSLNKMQRNIFKMFVDDDDDTIHPLLAACNNSSTMHYAAIENLSLPSYLATQLIITDGRIIFDQHYHARLYCSNASRETEPTVAHGESETAPNSVVSLPSGMHSKITFTIYETIKLLMLNTTVRFQDRHLVADLFSLIQTSWTLDLPQPCPHELSTPLSSEYNSHVTGSSIVEPFSKDDKKIAIARTQGDVAAQLLFCCWGTAKDKSEAVQQFGCCLNCIMNQITVGGETWKFIIAT